MDKGCILPANTDHLQADQPTRKHLKYLKRLPGWEAIAGWVLIVAAGWSLRWALVEIAGFRWGDSLMDLTNASVTVGGQWLLLRRYVRSAWLWLLAQIAPLVAIVLLYVVGEAAFYMLTGEEGANQVSEAFRDENLGLAIGAFVFGATYALLTARWVRNAWLWIPIWLVTHFIPVSMGLQVRLGDFLANRADLDTSKHLAETVVTGLASVLIGAALVWLLRHTFRAETHVP